MTELDVDLTLNKIQPKKTGTFRHRLIIETLSMHFAAFMQGQLLKGLDIGDPQLAIALAAAAVMSPST